MPSHYHDYLKFNNISYISADAHGSRNKYFSLENNVNFLEDWITDSKGGGKEHNNMPPYIVQIDGEGQNNINIIYS